VVIKILNQ